MQIRKLLYSGIVKYICRCFLGLFYDKKYLRGYFFDEKRMGWAWAWNGLSCKKIGYKRMPYPVHPQTIVSADRVHFDVDNLNIFQTPGCYWQTIDADIYVGKGSYIGPNVGLITTNHDPNNPDIHLPGKDIVLGESCWIGMNSVILPGVTLGDHTVVGAGSVVTKSFPDGYAVLGGNPARIIKSLKKNNDI